MSLPKLMTEAQVAEYLGVHTETVARLRRPGKSGEPPKLESVIVGGRKVRITEEQLSRYMETLRDLS